MPLRLFKLFLFIVIILVFLDQFLFSARVLAISPQFGLQEIKSTSFEPSWFDMKTLKPTHNGDPSAYIVAVDYFSDGKVLNATLWLLAPFEEVPATKIAYGMLIDADDNPNTGYSGIDYNFEVTSKENSHTWNKVLEKWSPVPILPYFSSMVLTNQSKYTGFFEKGKGFVSLSLNLGSVLYPHKYKVLFYAESSNKSTDLVDFTNWVHIPPPQIEISTIPRSLDLIQGDGQKAVEVMVNSTTGMESVVRLTTIQYGPEDIKPALTYSILPIPSYGIATTSLKIDASQSASIKPYTLFIFANSTFPKQVTKNSGGFSLADLVANNSINEPIVNHTSITINVHEPPSILDQINDFWGKVGSPIAFVYGIIAGISPWIYRTIRNYSKKRATRR